jgi:soluble lytic murein transglycosylase-like protein
MKKNQKSNVKRIAFLLVTLLLIGLTGLFIGLVDFNRQYEKKKENLNILAGEVFRLEQTIDRNDQKIKAYDLLEFKVNAFSTRYSLFSRILDSVYHKSRKYGFQPDLVLGILQVESDFNPNAVSFKGAYGLMQVNLPVWREELAIDKNRIFEVDYNIDLGLRILKLYFDETKGNLKLALHLYNNGYLYNNTSYADKVGSAVLAFRPSSQFDLSLGNPGYGK